MASFTHPTLGLIGLVPIPSQAPYRETLSWLTDVFPAYDGGEDRTMLRTKPRQRTNNDFTAQPVDSKDVYNTVYGGLARRWGIPLWAQARRVGVVYSGQMVIPVDTRYADFRVGDPILLLGTCRRWFVDFIAEKDDASITLVNGVSSLNSAFAIPVRIGRIISNGQKSTSGYGATWRISYEVDDNLFMEPDAPTQYYGDDIYLSPTLLEDGQINESVQTKLETFDFDVGLVKAFPNWDHNRTVRPYKVITETDAEAWSLRQWLYRRAGRYRAFWMPTFENDVRLYQTGTLASNVSVLADSRSPYTSNRMNLAFGLRNGNWLPRRIISDSSGGPNVRTLTLDSPLNVNAADVICISYLGYRRLESDQVDLSWIGNGCCEVNIPMLELNP